MKIQLENELERIDREITGLKAALGFRRWLYNRQKTESRNMGLYYDEMDDLIHDMNDIKTRLKIENNRRAEILDKINGQLTFNF